jgi:carboxyl-terminal processing protease
MGAARAGIAEGDEIVAIGGKNVDRMSAQEVHEALAGDVGTKVTLTVRRDGQGSPRDVVVERGPFKDQPAIADPNKEPPK